MKTKKRWISRVAVSLGLLTMFGGVALSAGSSVVNAAQTISDNPTSDDKTPRTITLWKYEIKSAAELGERGDGLELAGTAPELTGKTLMPDVHFEIVRVKANDGKPLTDPLKQKEGSTEDYTIDTTFPTTTGKTDTGGKLTFDASTILGITGATGHKAADGIYLIKEIPNPNTGKYDYTVAAEGPGTYKDPVDNKIKKEISAPMSPFFAYLPQTKRVEDPQNPGEYISSGELIYDVHVYPKNIVTDSELDKTVEGGKGYSIKAGEDFQWEATTKLPDGLYSKITEDMTIINMHDPVTGLPIADLDITASPANPYDLYADYFFVHDELAKELHLDGVKVQFYNPDTKVWDTMTLNNEYEVYKNGSVTKEAADPITDGVTGKTDIRVELTKAGMKKIEELTPERYSQIRVIYETHTEKDFNGIIENKYDTGYLIPGQKPKTDNSEDNPEYYDGGFNIKKVTEDGTTVLEGAEFHIALTKADAEAEIFLADDGVAYPKGTTGVTFLTAKSDASGLAKFDGLKLDWFTDTDSDGKQDPKNPAEATWDKIYDKNTDTGIHKKYWVVETKSPAGYELLKTPQEVTVTLDTHKDVGGVVVPELTVENKSKTNLPFTGGTGTMLLIIIAIGAITIGTAAIAIDKKRRHA